MKTLKRPVIHFVPLLELDTESQMKLREIRNEEGVRKWMYTDHIISANEHLDWIRRLKDDDRQVVFVLINDASDSLGVVSISAIDRLHNKADWAYYLTEKARGGLGSSVEYATINFVFDTLGLDKLNCEVIQGNHAVVKLHTKFLFKEEGFRRSNIVKNGERIGVHLLGVTRQEWYAGRKVVHERYASTLDKFSIVIQRDQSAACRKSNAIDEIEAARAKNNLNWMSILRLALEKSPQTAKPIVAEIRRIDREISLLTEKLINK